MSANIIRSEPDLSLNLDPRFTKWLAQSDALHEAFVLIDVGVLGGENERWHFLGKHLVVHGFDASKEVIDELSQRNEASPNKFFHWFAIGSEDEDRKFFYNPNNPSSSSFFEFPGTQARIVPVRRLDTLLMEGVIPKPDFLKVDVEGHERELFSGASGLIAGGMLAIEAETSFATSDVYPEPSFALIQARLAKHGLLISDLNFNRMRRENYQKARERRGLTQLPLEGAGKPATFNVLFCRDVVAEINGGAFYERLPSIPDVDQILKLMVIYELYGLNDVAVDIAMVFSNELSQRLDVEQAIDLLCENDGGGMREYLTKVRNLKLALGAARRQVRTLRRELSDDWSLSQKPADRIITKLDDIEKELNWAVVPGQKLPQPAQFTYEGQSQTTSVIPENPNDINREHGVGIMRISPPQTAGIAVLHIRVLLSCYCSEPNSVRVVIFESGMERPLAVLTEDVLATELTTIDQDFATPAMGAAQTPVLDVRVGLARPGGTLSLNRVPGEETKAASAIRLSWSPVENVDDAPVRGTPPYFG